MTHKELVEYLDETTSADLREIIMSQYIATLESHIDQLKKELAQARTVSESVCRLGEA